MRLSVAILLMVFSLDGGFNWPVRVSKKIHVPSAVKKSGKYDTSAFYKSRTRPVIGTHGMVVCDDVAAGQWGREILRLGGNAIDVAVAVAFMLAVTRPHYASIGGGGFAIYCPEGKKEGFAFDFRETAPSACPKDGNLHGARACGIPGTVHGLLTMHGLYGRINRRKLMQRPIKWALEGTPMSGNMHFAARDTWAEMNEEARTIFGQQGHTIQPGDLVVQRDLARTLNRVSKYGIDGFYKGPVARKIVDGLQKAGGVITRVDLLNYKTIQREPLYGLCKEHRIVTMPPSSSGGIALIQLFNFMDCALKEHHEPFNLSDSATWHIMAQALALVFADRNNYVGDPEFVNVPIKELLSCDYLMKRWMTFFDKTKFTLPNLSKQHISEGHDTTHIAIIDTDGNCVSMTLTDHSLYGSGFIPPGTGVVMNNELDDFAADGNRFGLKSSKLNCIQPDKRPLSSMMPTVIKKQDGTNCIVIGAAGGPQIISAVWQTLVNRFYFDMCIPDAVVQPRIHHQYEPNQVAYERGALSKEVCDSLTQKGHSLKEGTHLGTVQALEKMDDGYIWGISDPRSEGIAVGA